jgi:Holliday junction resolvasome RuvABC ATP-dependent DNA helicase subunit
MRTTHLVLSQVIEERLLYLDLIERMPQGRILTGKGMEHARKLKQEVTRA